MQSISPINRQSKGADLSARVILVFGELGDLFAQFFKRNAGSLKLVLPVLAAVLTWPILAIVCYVISHRISRSIPPTSDPTQLSKGTYKYYMSLLDEIGGDSTLDFDKVKSAFVRFYLKSTFGLIVKSGDRYINRVRTILAPLDSHVGKGSGSFMVRTQSDLWSSRTKAYDYTDV